MRWAIHWSHNNSDCSYIANETFNINYQWTMQTESTSQFRMDDWQETTIIKWFINVPAYSYINGLSNELHTAGIKLN